MTLTFWRLCRACLCAATALTSTPALAVPPERVTRSAEPVAAGPPTRNMRGFHTGDGRRLVVLEPDGKLHAAAGDGTRMTAAGVADAALLHLSRGHGMRPHVVWIGRGGLGFAPLDTGAASPVMLALPGRGGAMRAVAAARLAVAESSDGEPVILIGSRSGSVTAIAVSDRFGNIELHHAGHLSAEGAVAAIIAAGARARTAAAGAIRPLVTGVREPASSRATGGPR